MRFNAFFEPKFHRLSQKMTIVAKYPLLSNKESYDAIIWLKYPLYDWLMEFVITMHVSLSVGKILSQKFHIC